MTDELFLALDVGTGSVRAALMDTTGRIVELAAREHDQIVPEFGWAEQRPLDWWDGACTAIRTVLSRVEGAARRISMVAVCGQMHGLVLLDDAGQLTRDTAPLWNDKRTLDLVRRFEAENAPESYLAESGNPPTPAWPGFKLQWVRDADPQAYRRSAIAIMPKDYINFRLTGEIAMDTGDASCSFLMNPATRAWSPEMIARMGLEARLLPPIRDPLEVLGRITAAAATATGLVAGTPVLVGGADYPMALLGSGACRPGLGSDSTGTGAIVTMIAEKPLLDPEICNVATIEGHWAPFVLLETGGDGMRWARRAFHEGQVSYSDIVERAERAPPGSEALLFLPFLTGERLGAHRNSRAQFFGLGAGHGIEHLHRSILEGIAFAMARHIRIMEQSSGRRMERMIAAGGGARTKLWLKIKASVFDTPVLLPEEPECGLVGCAALAATATGRFPRVADAADSYVRYAEEIAPDPAWAEIYAQVQPVFDRLYHHSTALYDDMESLAARIRPAGRQS
ncbi:MAG: pentose kinase [Rhodobacteraceae bacterium]|jgi:xylulokinase|nr:pentose kinase [Paracoccaceae bacterium]